MTAPSVSADDAAALANDNLAFAVDMHLALRVDEPGNFIFSQTSISTALAMLYAGAATTTATEMADALHFGLPAERLHPALQRAGSRADHAARGQQRRARSASRSPTRSGSRTASAVLPTYLDTLAENYGAGLFVEDFGDGAGAGARRDQRLGLRSHGGSDPGAVSRRGRSTR